MEKISRICFNNEGWLFPSGRKDKAVNKDSYERKNGFGHEEWLLDFSKTIDGYHYGFLQPLNGYHHAGNIYDIHLFFYTQNTGKAYIGCIKNAECIDENEAKRALEIYKKKRWYDDMLETVKNVPADPELLKKEGHQVFNVRFKPKDFVDCTSNPRHISQIDPNTRGLYYRLMDKRAEFIFDDEFGAISHVTKRSKNKVRKAADSKSEKTVHGGVYERNEYNPIHNKVQNDIKRILESSADYSNVLEEKNFVDLTATFRTGEIHYFEIKTNTARLSIREALGQILEYSDYPNSSRATKLIIVSVKPLDDSDCQYMKHLRERYHIPVWYRYYSLDAKTLGEEQ